MVAVKTCQIMLIRTSIVHWAIPIVDSPSEAIGMAAIATVMV